MINSLKYLEVTPNIIRTAIVTEESNTLVRPYLMTNMSCIQLPDELIFVNCGPRTDLAQKFREDMESRFKKNTSHLILTGKRWDCFYGINAFEDTTIVSSSATKSGIRQNIKKGVDSSWREWIIRQIPEDDNLRSSLLEMKFVIPHIGFSKRKIVGPDSYPLKLEVGLAGALSIYCPIEKVLFTGNIIQSSFPSFMWPITGVGLYKKWETLDIDTIIPGRGPHVGKKFLSAVRQWMEEVIIRLRSYRDQGIPEKQILRQEYPDHPTRSRISWIEGGDYHTGTVQRLIRYWYKQVLKEEVIDEDLMFIS
ncbi:MAG: hypothetical protein ACXABI_08010 [Candidatus Hodarchaeales archaeon]|jgi:hypothetical protein